MLLYHFHELPGITIVANLAAFPAVSPALLLGLAAGALGLVWVQAGQLVALIARAPLRYLELLAEHLAKAPVAWITSSGGVPMFLLQLGLVIAFAAWLRTGWRPPRAAVLVAGVLLPVFIWSSALSAGPPSGLTVRFIDVGQGDATLITSAAGVHVLIDGGPDPDQVATVLESLGVRRLDLVVESHPHADHIAGLASVLTRFPVGLFVEPGCPDQTSLEREVEDTVSELHVPERFPRMGDELTVGDLRFDVLSPDRCWNGTNSDPNNDSLVMMVHDGEDTVLMSGEPEREAQQVMLDDHEELSAEVLKCPHHGGDTSLPAWFDAVDPQVVVIPVGLNNPYGHPSPVVLQELAATGARIFRTDQDGTVVVSFSGQGIQVRSDR